MQYRIIKSQAQYKSYKSYLGRLLSIEDKSSSEIESSECLIALIKRWDKDHNTVSSFLPIISPEDAVDRLISFMNKNNMRPSELATAIQISQTSLADILNRKMQLTSDVIARISKKFGAPLLV